MLTAIAVAVSLAAFARQAPLPVGKGSQRVAQAKTRRHPPYGHHGLRGPLQRVRAEIEKAIGRTLVVQYSESRVLQREIEFGQPFALALVTADVIDSGIATGVMLKEKADIARIRVGVFQRGGTSAQDISSKDGLTRTLLGAKSIRWSAHAAAEPSVLNTFTQLNIGDAVNHACGRPSWVSRHR